MLFYIVRIGFGFGMLVGWWVCFGLVWVCCVMFLLLVKKIFMDFDCDFGDVRDRVNCIVGDCDYCFEYELFIEFSECCGMRVCSRGVLLIGGMSGGDLGIWLVEFGIGWGDGLCVVSVCWGRVGMWCGGMWMWYCDCF